MAVAFRALTTTAGVVLGLLAFVPTSRTFSTNALLVAKFRRPQSLLRKQNCPRLEAQAGSQMTASSQPTSQNQVLRFCDIGANLLDERFIEGIYRGSFRHDPDLDAVVVRAAATGVRRIILTAGTIDESRVAVQKAREWNARYKEQQQQQQQRLDVLFSCTVGVHPTRCSQVFAATANVDAEAGDSANADDNAIDKTTTTSDSDTRLLNELLEICKDGMKDGTVVAVGEIGLDYDRLEFCPADIQQKYLILQLQTLAAQTGLPLFLHNRSVGDDLYRILVEYGDCWRNNGGVVHSFDDSMELASKFTQDLGLYIGINGCSLRTNENLETVEQLPLEHILLETDCPYCDVRSTHTGYQYIQTKFPAQAEKKFVAGQCVKNRQEPCHIIQVAEIVAGVKNLPFSEVANECYANSLQLFRWKE